MQRREILESVSALTAVSTAGLAGCSGILGDDEPSEGETPTDCPPPGEDLTDAFPAGDAYEREELSEFEGEKGPGVRSAISIYRDGDGQRYEFFVVEYEDATTAEDSAGVEGYEGDGVPGYLVIDKYSIGGDGPSQEELIAFMETSSLLGGCVEDNIRFS